MTQHDNGNAASAEPGSALVGQPTSPGMGNGPGMPMTTVGPALAPSAPDVLKGGMDRSSLFHALRRRWLLATSMGLLLGATVTAALYIFFPEQNSATAQYRVASTQLQLLETASSQSRDYDVYKNTQVAYIRSPLVLIAALGANNSAIARLPMFNDVDDQVAWLSENIQATFPSRGEVLEIKMAGPYPEEDLKKVVEAVSTAYYEEVVFREQSDRVRPLSILQKSQKQLSGQVREKLETYQSLAKDSGTSEAYAGTFDPETKLMLSEVGQIISQRAELEGQIADATTNFRIFETQMKDPSTLEQRIDAAVAADPMVAELNAQIVGLQLQIRSQAAISKRGRSAGIRRLESQLAQYQQEVAQMRDQLRAQLSGQQSGEPDPLLKSQTVAFTITSQALQGQLAQLTQRLEELKQDLLLKAENNTDLMLKLAEIEHLRRVEQSVADRIQNLQVEVLAPNRVTPVGGKGTGAALAETSQDRNLLARVAIAGIGGLGTLGATMLGIGFMEFTGRRLNGPWQVDEGLGIRVIGTLPRLQGKKALNPKHPIVGQLNESIDSVRTALMHESTAKRRQLVLVTGAETGEGVTTVASQLAASLARAGRRTLLIDGDLRRPALHSLFNSPLEDGLCEVLRAEAEVTDVIRPTPAESLWLMTAGYCDVDAVRALATDQMQPIFEKLRAEYDFIIVNGAPLVGLSDSLLFGQQCDGAILSVLRDRTCVTKLNESAELLRSVGVRIIGAVVNGVAARTDRRVTHLQQVTPKSEQKKLETVDA